MLRKNVVRFIGSGLVLAERGAASVLAYVEKQRRHCANATQGPRSLTIPSMGPCSRLTNPALQEVIESPSISGWPHRFRAETGARGACGPRVRFGGARFHLPPVNGSRMLGERWWIKHRVLKRSRSRFQGNFICVVSPAHAGFERLFSTRWKQAALRRSIRLIPPSSLPFA